MSVVAHPFPHAPFRDPAADLFAPSGAATSHAEFPPVLDPPNLRPPFPIFQHRHTSPYPMTFSALGAPEDAALPLHAAQPPPAPKPNPSPLPRTRTYSADRNPAVASSSTLSPLPLPHERERAGRRHRPEAMVKLAPPADDGYEAVQGGRVEDSDTPRRSPGGDLDLNNIDSSPSTSVSRSNSDGRRKKRTDAEMAKRRSMGPPPRPVRANTAYPASTPGSVRMEPSRSADSRARSRAAMPARSHTFSPYAVPFPAAAGGSKSLADLSTPPGQDRTSTSSADADSADLGGPEGLEAKVVLLGSQGVGKTSLILRYTTRTYTPSAAPATIGSSLHTRKLVHGGIRVKLQIWDTAGQERFRSMAPIYYRGAHVCVLVYDISDRQSFEDVRSWLEELGRTVPKETVIYVVGSKVDLERKRAVTLDEARSSIRSWTKPPAPPVPLLSPPPQKSLFRSSSTSKGLEASSSNTPSRSYSHGALAAYEIPLPRSNAPSAAPTPARIPSSGILTNGNPTTQPLSNTVPSPAPVLIPKSRPPPALRIIATSLTSPRRVAFPTLQSPTASITGTTTEHVNSSITPSSPTRHGISGGRFSISGVLGMSRTESMSGAAMNLAKLAEEYPVDRTGSSSSRLSPPQLPTRVRTESTPLLGGPSQASSRRKSEDWSSRSWRMGGGPGAAEALGEFGASIKKKESEELLSNAGGAGRRGSSASGMSLSVPMVGQASDDSSSSKEGQQTRIVRSRGGSLGRDSRLYPSSEEEDGEWGVEVGGVRLGECSSLSGIGVEALFKSISSLLVKKKDKIERERQLRRKGSVMLVDPARDIAQAGNKGRFGCCA